MACDGQLIDGVDGYEALVINPTAASFERDGFPSPQPSPRENGHGALEQAPRFVRSE